MLSGNNAFSPFSFVFCCLQKRRSLSSLCEKFMPRAHIAERPARGRTMAWSAKTHHPPIAESVQAAVISFLHDLSEVEQREQPSLRRHLAAQPGADGAGIISSVVRARDGSVVAHAAIVYDAEQSLERRCNAQYATCGLLLGCVASEAARRAHLDTATIGHGPCEEAMQAAVEAWDALHPRGGTLLLEVVAASPSREDVLRFASATGFCALHPDGGGLVALDGAADAILMGRSLPEPFDAREYFWASGLASSWTVEPLASNHLADMALLCSTVADLAPALMGLLDENREGKAASSSVTPSALCRLMERTVPPLDTDAAVLIVRHAQSGRIVGCALTSADFSAEDELHVVPGYEGARLALERTLERGAGIVSPFGY
jgi:hypothetical protein